MMSSVRADKNDEHIFYSEETGDVIPVKKKKIRLLYTFILISFVIAGLILSSFITIKTYFANKILEPYDEEKILNMLENDYKGYKINNLVIDTKTDSRSFGFSADAIKVSDIYTSSFSLQYSFVEKNGKWVLKNKDVSSEVGSWNLQGTTWSAKLDSGSYYKILFNDSMNTVKVSLNEIVQQENQQAFILENISKELKKAEEGEVYIASIERPDNTKITFTISKKKVMLDLGNREGEIALKKE